ncbi:hypothetical protein ARALYDRAFT_896797 [Arabidopsis lyrata subsp. lyrata]|uniref:Uncharacterized protein n=1 Tax=Arabidopsis lyrata subsp. lyrata TaxID=81972 RepID=D7L5X5_ARALL|nr:hypothetical protein ARALYDRAFT_896797 [Arabidopsis lyrata subsp. lyrata]
MEMLLKYARSNLLAVKYLEYAFQVETYTLSKANNLLLNVDGAIRYLFSNLLGRSRIRMFT